MTLVVDSSVAFKWFVSDEPYADEARAVVRDGGPLLAPDILVAEVCNAAWRSARLGRIEPAQLAAMATGIALFFDELVAAAALAPRAAVIARQLDHPVYDCLYVALAEARQVTFVSADARLVAKLQGTQWAAATAFLADYRGGI